MNFDINFDFNFWSILFLIGGYILGSFTKRVGKSNEIDQIIRDAAQIQATNRDLEMQNDRLNDTLFESTKENQRLINLNSRILDDFKDVPKSKKYAEENSSIAMKLYVKDYFNEVKQLYDECEMSQEAQNEQ